jgi:hypothetical protein
LDGSLVTSVSGTRYKFNHLDPDTTYTLGVRAKDEAGNTSSLATEDGTTL